MSDDLGSCVLGLGESDFICLSVEHGVPDLHEHISANEEFIKAFLSHIKVTEWMLTSGAWVWGVVNCLLHPMVWRDAVLNAIDNVRQVTVYVLWVAVGASVPFFMVIIELVQGPHWERQQWSASVRSESAWVVFVTTEAKRFSIYLDVVQLDGPEELVDDVVPFQFTIIVAVVNLVLVVATEDYFWLFVFHVQWHVESELIFVHSALLH